jgi:hypothetical protein
MISYLPRFTLRRALIAMALFALFLGWLRPDRTEIDNYPGIHAATFKPMWLECRITAGRRVNRLSKSEYRTTFEFKVVFE